MIYYSRIFQTGIQSLLAVGCGWACGRWQVVDAEPTVQYTNTLVLRFCIPCLQIWLLAIKTDMQQADNWRALAAFLLWSVGLQVLLVLHQLLTRQHLQCDRLGVDGLILTTNNTGILGPVVLEAAVGAQYAPLGMLATVVLYFQQLPLAQLLFQLHHQQQQQQQHTQTGAGDAPFAPPPTAAAAAAAGVTSDLAAAAGHKHIGSSKIATSPEPGFSLLTDRSALLSVSCSPEPNTLAASSSSNSSSSSSWMLVHGRQHSQLRHLHPHTPPAAKGSSSSSSNNSFLNHQQQQQQQQQQQHQQQQQQGHIHSLQTQQQPHPKGQAGRVQQARHDGFGSVGSLLHHGSQQHTRRLSWDMEQQQQQQHVQESELQAAGRAAADPNGEQQPLLLVQPALGGARQQHGLAAFTLSLLLKNPLVWSTAVAVVLSALGSAALLDPRSPLALQHLAFIEALLGWFAQTTAPLTLFTTGLWMYSNSQQQQQQQAAARQPAGVAAAFDTGLAGSRIKAPYGSTEVSWRDVWVHLLLRSTVAPAMMVVVCRVMGFRGDLAHALVILALLPVAQTAFVVCKQAETGMAAVSTMLVASLFMMLPQLLVVLALLDKLGVLSAVG